MMISEAQAELLGRDLKIATDTFTKTALGMKDYRETVSHDVDNACLAMITSSENSMKTVENMMGIMVKMEERHSTQNEALGRKLDEAITEIRDFGSKITQFDGQRDNLTRCLQDLKSDNKKILEDNHGVSERLIVLETKQSSNWGWLKGSIPLALALITVIIAFLKFGQK
jgi:chromosome segregation ATPase